MQKKHGWRGEKREKEKKRNRQRVHFDVNRNSFFFFNSCAVSMLRPMQCCAVGTVTFLRCHLFSVFARMSMKEKRKANKNRYTSAHLKRNYLMQQHIHKTQDIGARWMCNVYCPVSKIHMVLMLPISLHALPIFSQSAHAMVTLKWIIDGGIK